MSVVVDQISTAPDRRDADWLRTSLQSAIQLEHATLPLYTAAMLSLEVQNYPTYNTIRSVLMEEMVHMAIAANMLAALGGAPKIRALDPGYPCHGLPGGAEPDLRIGLAKLSRAQLANCRARSWRTSCAWSHRWTCCRRRVVARDTRPSAGAIGQRSPAGTSVPGPVSPCCWAVSHSIVACCPPPIAG